MNRQREEVSELIVHAEKRIERIKQIKEQENQAHHEGFAAEMKELYCEV